MQVYSLGTTSNVLLEGLPCHVMKYTKVLPVFPCLVLTYFELVMSLLSLHFLSNQYLYLKPTTDKHKENVEYVNYYTKLH